MHGWQISRKCRIWQLVGTLAMLMSVRVPAAEWYWSVDLGERGDYQAWKAARAPETPQGWVARLVWSSRNRAAESAEMDRIRDNRRFSRHDRYANHLSAEFVISVRGYRVYEQREEQSLSWSLARAGYLPSSGKPILFMSIQRPIR